MDPDTQAEAWTRTFAVSALFAHAVFALLEWQALAGLLPRLSRSGLGQGGMPQPSDDQTVDAVYSPLRLPLVSLDMLGPAAVRLS